MLVCNACWSPILPDQAAVRSYSGMHPFEHAHRGDCRPDGVLGASEERAAPTALRERRTEERDVVVDLSAKRNRPAR
jgi:hypothetical protein